MKSALKRIFPGNVSDEDDNAQSSLTAETCYVRRGAKGFSMPAPSKSKLFNPRNKAGLITRCIVCDSKMHYANNCPHNRKRYGINVVEENEDVASDTEESEQVNAILLAKDQENILYVAEASGCAILDTACTKTVCGKSWLDDYISKLDEENRKTVIQRKGGTSFQFGDGRKVKSTKNVLIPAVVANTKCHINVDVIDEDLPLLFSKTTLKNSKTTINLGEDKATMLGKSVELQLTANGHYCVDILPGKKTDRNQKGEISLV